MPTTAAPPARAPRATTAPQLPDLDPALHARLEEDIRVRGCIVPVVVTEDGRVVDGRIRLQICNSLGITPKKIIVGNLSEAEALDWRLVLNTYRRHLSRVQVQEVIAWELSKAPHQSDRAHAVHLGVSHRTVAAVRAATGHLADHRTGRDGRIRPTVVHTVTEAKARAVARDLQVLGAAAPAGERSHRDIKRSAAEHRRAQFVATLDQSPSSHTAAQVLHGDFRQARIASNSVDLVVCDPPWSQWRQLGKSLGDVIFAALRPNGVACIYTGNSYSVHWCDLLRQSGLAWEWQVVVTYGNDNRPLHDVAAIRCLHTPIMIFRKHPVGCLVNHHTKPLPDVLHVAKPEKQYHRWQQSLGPLIEVVRCLSGPGAMVVDLTAGSGTTGVAVARVGEGRRFVGWDSDEEAVRIARGRIADEVAGK